MAQQFDPAALARIIIAEPDPAACAACLDQLEAFVTAQLAADSATAAARYPTVAEHLDGCVACAESYGVLYDALEAPAQEAPPVPAPDLSFLPARPTLFERVGAVFVLRLSAALAAPQPLAGALRSAGAPLLDIRLASPDTALEEVQVSAYAQPGAPERCDLRVLVVPVGRTWPALDGTLVTLRSGAQTQTAQTDQYGEALFAGVETAVLTTLELSVEVTSA